MVGPGPRAGGLWPRAGVGASVGAEAGAASGPYGASMRVMVLAERLPAAPWSPGRVALGLAGRLAARGHAVVLLADAVERGRDVSGLAEVVVREGFCHRGRVPPVGYRRFVAAELERRGLAGGAGLGSVSAGLSPAGGRPEVVLSFTRLVPSVAGLLGVPDDGACPTLWVPLQRGARGAGRELLAQFRPPMNFESLLRRVRLTPGRLARAAVEAWASRTRAGRDELGLFAAGAEAGPRTGRPVGGVTWLPALRPGAAGGREGGGASEDRRRVRELLRIDPGAVVLLMPVDRPTGAELAPVMEAVAGAGAGRDGTGAVLLVLGGEPVSVLAAGERAGLVPGREMRVLPRTHRFAAVAAAADIALVAQARPSAASANRVRPVPPTQTHDPARLVAELLSVGLPVIARAGAPGASMVLGSAAGRPADGRGGALAGSRPDEASLRRGPCGLVVVRHDARTWSAALDCLLAPETRAAARVAARATADVATGTIEEVTDALEQTLARLAETGRADVGT